MAQTWGPLQAAPGQWGYWIPSGGIFSAGNRNWSADNPSLHRFANVPIPQGAVIVSANVHLLVDNSSGQDYVAFLNVDNATIPPGYDGPWTSEVLLTSGTTRDYDVADSLQTVVDRPGWSNGNGILLEVRTHGSYNKFYGTYANSLPAITVQWEIPADGTAAFGYTLTLSATGDAPYVPPAEGVAAPYSYRLEFEAYGETPPAPGANGTATDLGYGLGFMAAGARDSASDTSINYDLAVTAAGARESTGDTLIGYQLQFTAAGGQPPIPPPPPWEEGIRSDAYLDALTARTATIDARVEIVDEDDAILATLGGEDATHPGVISGTVTWDRLRQYRWDGSITIGQSSLVPTDVGDLLHPLSHNRVRIWWRILVAPAQWVEVPLGTLAPDLPEVTDDGESEVTMSINCRDISSLIDMVELQSSQSFGGARADDAIRSLLSDAAPWAALNLTPSEHRLPADYEAGEPGANVWKVATGLAESSGLDLWVDRMGVVRLTDIPDPAAPPRARFVEGPGCAAIAASAAVPLDRIANRVTVTSTANTDADGNELDPIEVTVTDDDYTSPLWVGNGHYYDLSETSDAVTTEAQATAVATGLMRDAQSLIEDGELVVFPHPHLNPGDVLDVAVERIGMFGTRQITGWSLALGDLGGQTISLTGRREW